MLDRIASYNKAGTFVSSNFETEAKETEQGETIEAEGFNAVEALKAYRESLPADGTHPSRGEYAMALVNMLKKLDHEKAFTLDTEKIDEHLTADQKADVAAEVTAIEKTQTGLRS